MVMGLGVLSAGIALGTAAATPIKWVPVQLGIHRFGQLEAPDAIVARAGPEAVAFAKPGECGCGDTPGPVSFDVARTGSIWVFDVLNNRLLVWQRGRPHAPTRSIPLPKKLDVRDFALGRNGTIYLYAVYKEPPARDSGDPLWALAPSGKVLWRAPAKLGDALRIGPNDRLFAIGAYKKDPASWTPLTTPSGAPLSLAKQRRLTTPFQPLAGGLHILSIQLSQHEIHFALVDHKGTVVRAWRITSRTQLELARYALTPAVLGGDLVVPVDVSRQTKHAFLWEHIVLRLAATGSRSQLSLNARAVWGDGLGGNSTPLRVGPDGRLYQLRTNPKTGVSVARYSLGARKES